MIYKTRKNIAAGYFNAMPLGSSGGGPETVFKPYCKRYKTHRWNQSFGGRYCMKCGMHEEYNYVSKRWEQTSSNPKVRGPRTDQPERTNP